MRYGGIGVPVACLLAGVLRLAGAADVPARPGITALAREPFSRCFDFEDGADPFVAWASNATYTVNFKGITEEQAASGKRAFKLDLTFRSGSYVYWSVPVRFAAEGTLRAAASLRIGDGSSGRVGVGANVLCKPSVHSGCGPYVIEQLASTQGQWLRREIDLVPLAQESAANIARKHVALADGDNVGAVVDRIGLFVAGKAGDRVVVYLDDLRLEGEVPSEADYLKQVAVRWASVAVRREEAFAKLHAALAEIRQEVEQGGYHASGARCLGQRIVSRIPQWQAQLAAAQAERDLQPGTFEALRDTLEALSCMCATIREVEARNLSFQDAILYALDNPIVGFQILPRDLVPPARVATDLQVTAAQGEIRATSLIVQALRGLAHVTVSVSDLKPESGGAALPSSAVDVRVVKCWYQAGSAWHGIGQKKGQRVLTPELLVHDDRLLRVDENEQKNFLRLSHPEGDVYWNTEDPAYAQDRAPTILPVEKFPVRDAKTLQGADLPADTLRQYWLTLRTPESARPGTYVGSVTVDSEAGVVGKTELRLRVLPFRLPMPRTAYDSSKVFTSSIYYRGVLNEKYPQGSLSSEYKSEEQLRAELRDMADHGIFNPTSYQPLHSLTNYLRVRDESGLRGLPLYTIGVSIGSPQTEAQLAALAQTVGKVRALTGAFGIPEVYLYGIDEARGEQLLAQRKAWKRVREAGAKSFVAGYKGHFEVIGDLLDVQVQANVPSLEDSAQWHSAGGKIFCYANPQTGPENPEVFRRNYGLFLWLKNYDGAMTYAYQHAFGNIYDDFDHATYREHVFSYPTADGVLPTLAIEGYREGINDIRYGTLLKSLLEANARADGPRAATVREAAEWLARLDTTRDLEAIRQEMVVFILKLRE